MKEPTKNGKESPTKMTVIFYWFSFFRPTSSKIILIMFIYIFFLASKDMNSEDLQMNNVTQSYKKIKKEDLNSNINLTNQTTVNVRTTQNQ